MKQWLMQQWSFVYLFSILCNNIFVLLFLLPRSRNTDVKPHDRFPPPSPAYACSCLALCSDTFSAILFLRRLLSTCAYSRYALSAVNPCFYVMSIKYNQSKTRSGSNSEINFLLRSRVTIFIGNRGDRMCLQPYFIYRLNF